MLENGEIILTVDADYNSNVLSVELGVPLSILPFWQQVIDFNAITDDR